MTDRLLSCLLILLVGVGSLQSARAQTTVEGIVTDASTGEPLIGANVAVDGTAAGTTTDVEGRFRLQVNPPAVLRFTYVGYGSAMREVSEGVTTLEVALESRIIQQGAVVVSASRRREKITEAPAAISVLYGRDLEAQTLTSPVEALRNVGGVDVSEQGINSYTVTLRGRNLAFDTATHILIDNRQATTPGLSVTIFGRQPLNPDDIDRVEVIRGPGSALYGPGVDAGVIHFITKNPFDHPGTTVSLAGGGRSTTRFLGTHRGVIGRKLGYKITGIYASANSWEYDPSDPEDAAFLDALPVDGRIVSAVDGRLFATIDGFDFDTFTRGVTGSLEYRPSESTSIAADAGYTRYKGINRFTLGEIFNDFPEIFGTVRLRSGNLFVQGHYLNAANDERTYLYRTGKTLAFNNHQFDLQAQYTSELPSWKTSLTYGGEYQLVTTDTQGTIDGMFEDEDATTIFGAYAQSQTDLSDRLSLTLAGRLDRFHTIEQTVFSPRAGLVYRPNPAHSVRLTFNRAFASPTNLSLFTDVAVADLAQLDERLVGDVQLIGGASRITFDQPPQTVSFIPGVGVYDGMGIPLRAAYLAALALAEGDLPPAAIELLTQRTGLISGYAPGVPIDPITEEINSAPRERTYLLKPQKTDMIELGYTWVLPRFYLSASGYYTRKNDFESDIRVFGRLVGIASDLGAGLAGAVSDALSDADLQALGLERGQIEALFEAAGDAIAEDPVGLIQADQVPYSGRPQLVSTFVNYGEIDYWGLELSATYLLTDGITLTANYTRLSQVDFTGEDLGVEEGDDRYALNVPRNSFGIKADYTRGTTGLTGSLAYRYKESFEGDFGDLFAGTVDEQNIVDAAVGYALPNGVALNITAQNVFDSRYRSFVGLPKIGRLLLASVRYSF